MPYACIFVADFPAQAVLRAEPQLRNFALAVLEGAPPQERLVAMNEFARRSGVQLGMPRSLLEQCPSLALRHRSPELETAAHEAQLEVAQAFTPRVEETAPDTLVLDLAGLEQLFGPPEQIAAALAQRVSEAGCEARIAVAANPDAAIAAARGFAGVTVIPPGREAEALGALPLAALAMPPEIHETLERWGIRDFRSLAALPTVQLSERLGQAGVRLQQLARGASTRALVCANAAAEFTAAMELEY
ncbi:MAG: DNA polymerase Y family protein, partial [Candidatus Acidiferrales bacterium]